jgi:hypothetical protein
LRASSNCAIPRSKCFACGAEPRCFAHCRRN